MIQSIYERGEARIVRNATDKTMFDVVVVSDYGILQGYLEKKVSFEEAEKAVAIAEAIKEVKEKEVV